MIDGKLIFRVPDEVKDCSVPEMCIFIRLWIRRALQIYGHSVTIKTPPHGKEVERFGL